MKRIFCFLLTLVVGFLSVEKSFATRYNVDGKVRYAIELKQLDQQAAQQALANGYVDLWVYAYFSQEFVNQGMITVSNGAITSFKINFTPGTHAYKIIDKDGNLDKTGSIARFAPAASRGTACGRPTTQQSKHEDGQVSPVFVEGSCCPIWYFGASTGQSANIGSRDLPYATEIVEAEGQTWYVVKLYQIRYEWLSMKSFYTTFYSYTSAAADRLGCETDASTFSISFDGQTNPIVPSRYVGDDQDWSFYVWDPNRNGVASDPVKDRCAFIRGGVEVISDPEMLLTAEATCGGTDLPGKLSVNDWAEKTWADYSGVKFYVNKTGGSVSGRKQVSTGDLTATIPTTGTAAEIAYTLTPSGYTMPDGSYADSLIWVIEDTFLA